jgi:outer membrane biosynthesis protein TonB
MKQSDQPVNIKAIAWTLGIHGVILLLFMLVSYTLPASEPQEELGMEVNLGTSYDGSGDDQPMAVDAPAAASSINSRATAQQRNDIRNMLPGDDPDAPSISPADRTNNDTRPNPTNNTRPGNNLQEANAGDNAPRQPRYVMPGATGPGGNNAATNRPGTSEGNTTGNGDRGVPGGTPGASNYTGNPGNGTGGISHTLSGRDISPRRFEAEFNEGGKVVIKVTVDRDGNIVDKKVKSFSSAVLKRIALQKLSQSKFSKSPDAEPRQFGEITFVFKTRS